jgi:thiol-disulfide isomerase/thioredoxin
VTPTDIFFISKSGMGNAKLVDLDPDLQQHFHFNAALATAQVKVTPAPPQYQVPQDQTPQSQTPAASEKASRPADNILSPSSDASEGLSIGERLPDFHESDREGSPLSVSGARGKLVLVDFWATWCGPCRRELPNVIAAYQKYHASGFEVIGVSLDQDSDRLASFTASEGMPWPEYFDGQGWDNKLAQQYDVRSIPANYLLDRNGIIIGKGLRGAALDRAVNAALGGDGSQ